MILFHLSLYRSRMGAAEQRPTLAAVATPDGAHHHRVHAPAFPSGRCSAARAAGSLFGKEVSVSVIPAGPYKLADFADAVRACFPAGARPSSIVRSFVPMRIHAQEIPAMPAESGLVRLQEEFEDLQDRMTELDAYVLTASADGEFSPIELAEYRKRRNGAFIQGEEVGRSISCFADAVGLAKTVLHAGAVTPWAARQASERSEDRLRLLSTPIAPPNVIPFPESDHGPRAA